MEVQRSCFFYVENAYDMMLKEGLIVKLHQMGIRGKMYRWIKCFLIDRIISVRIGKDFSGNYLVENGTPQGSIVSRDASKTLYNKVGVVFIIQELNVMSNKMVSDNLAVYTVEVLANLLALNWIKEVKPIKVLIGSDSSSPVVVLNTCSKTQGKTEYLT